MNTERTGPEHKEKKDKQHAVPICYDIILNTFIVLILDRLQAMDASGW